MMAEDFGGAPPADPAASLRADPSFRAALDGSSGWGPQQRAQEQISARFRAVYGDGPAEPVTDPTAIALRSQMRAGLGSTANPVVLQRDPGFRARLQSGDHRVRDHAQAQLTQAYAGGDGQHIGEPERPNARTHSDDGVPVRPELYDLTDEVADLPDLAAAVRETCHTLRLPTHQAIAFSRSLERLASHEPPGPDTLQAQSDGLLDLVTRAEFDRASAAWRRLEAGDPALATLLEELGACTDPEFVRLLARTPRR